MKEIRNEKRNLQRAGVVVTTVTLTFGAAGFLRCPDPACREAAEEALTTGLRDETGHTPKTMFITLTMPMSVTTSSSVSATSFSSDVA